MSRIRDAQEKAKQLWIAGSRTIDIAEAVGVAARTVQWWAQKHRWPEKLHRALPEYKDLAAEWRRLGYDPAEGILERRQEILLRLTELEDNLAKDMLYGREAKVDAKTEIELLRRDLQELDMAMMQYVHAKKKDTTVSSTGKVNLVIES